PPTMSRRTFEVLDGLVVVVIANATTTLSGVLIPPWRRRAQEIGAKLRLKRAHARRRAVDARRCDAFRVGRDIGAGAARCVGGLARVLAPEAEVAEVGPHEGHGDAE